MCELSHTCLTNHIVTKLHKFSPIYTCYCLFFAIDIQLICHKLRKYLPELAPNTSTFTLLHLPILFPPLKIVSSKSSELFMLFVFLLMHGLEYKLCESKRLVINSPTLPSLSNLRPFQKYSKLSVK